MIKRGRWGFGNKKIGKERGRGKLLGDGEMSEGGREEDRIASQ